ncbi:MAG: Gfo/Idh/MocA family oxidoreductase [Verrucomicrobia bacterium]|nr:Gfo/Idh/MocA family oxidoreductase [Verrucomicrobiota bacterium]
MHPEPLSIAIIGGGSVGEHFLRDLAHHPSYHVTGVVTRSTARQEELSAKYGVAGFGRFRDLVDTGGTPRVACVVNANHDHLEATIEALEAGCHVYLEKPMAPTLAECRQIVEAEARSRGTVQVGFEYIHGSMTARLKDLIEEGYFGEVQWLSILDSRGHWWSQSPHGILEEVWKLDRKRGGGLIYHCGIHQLDLIRHYAGNIRTVQAFCPAKNPLSFYPADVPGNVTLMITTERGVTVNFQVMHDRAATWYREKAYRPDYAHAPGHEFNISVIGTGGSCDMRLYTEELHLFTLDAEQKENRFDRTEVFRPNPHDKSHHDMSGLLSRFLASVAGGGGAIDAVAGAYETMRAAWTAEEAILRPGECLAVDELT